MNNQDITKYSEVVLLFDFLLRDKGTEHSSVGDGRVFLEENQISPVSHSGRPRGGGPGVLASSPFQKTEPNNFFRFFSFAHAARHVGS